MSLVEVAGYRRSGAAAQLGAVSAECSRNRSPRRKRGRPRDLKPAFMFEGECGGREVSQFTAKRDVTAYEKRKNGAKSTATFF